jgi:bifunctional UDP-N-acetylglucosamine pyrophosphorylase/glucosamine-1-phosphate N-acetyltransferase
MTIKAAVILAAGKGSRLHKLTKSRSKAMLPVAGKPMVERVMAPLISNGITDFIIVINPDDNHLINYFTNECRLDVKIDFVHQESALGTAHALHAAAPYLHQDFLLSACDNLVPAAHIREIINKWITNQPLNGVLSLMVVDKDKLSNSAMVQIADNYVTQIIEKPPRDVLASNISSIPLYCFSPQILNYLHDVPLSVRGEFEIQDAIQMLIVNEGVVFGVFTNHRLTITYPKDLLYINKLYLNQYKYQRNKIPESIGSNLNVLPPIHIEDGSIVGKNCAIGPNVYIESGSMIEDHVTISDSVILRGARIVQGSSIQDQITA